MCLYACYVYADLCVKRVLMYVRLFFVCLYVSVFKSIYVVLCIVCVVGFCVLVLLRSMSMCLRCVCLLLCEFVCSCMVCFLCVCMFTVFAFDVLCKCVGVCLLVLVYISV